ncbi:MAG: NifU family protein [Acidobacteria bacterium]|nr:MAG: NifU family protein [Acidobacteriota bacterium]
MAPIFLLGVNMENDKVYITANPTPNPNCLKFIVDRPIVDGAPISINSIEEAKGNPLAEKLFALGHVSQLFSYQNFVTVTKKEGPGWQDFAREIGQTIREHIQSGEKNFDEVAMAQAGEDSPAVRTIKAVLDEVRPSLAMDGGNIVFAGYKEGVVQVYMQGSCSGCPSSTITLKAGIEARIREVLPEIKEVVAL